MHARERAPKGPSRQHVPTNRLQRHVVFVRAGFRKKFVHDNQEDHQQASPTLPPRPFAPQRAALEYGCGKNERRNETKNVPLFKASDSAGRPRHSMNNKPKGEDGDTPHKQRKKVEASISANIQPGQKGKMGTSQTTTNGEGGCRHFGKYSANMCPYSLHMPGNQHVFARLVPAQVPVIRHMYLHNACQHNKHARPSRQAHHKSVNTL